MRYELWKQYIECLEKNTTFRQKKTKEKVAIFSGHSVLYKYITFSKYCKYNMFLKISFFLDNIVYILNVGEVKINTLS